MKKQNEKIKFWQRLWVLLEPSRKDIKTILFFVFAMELIVLISPYILKLIIDRLTNFSPELIREILLLITLMVLSGVFESFLSWIKNRRIFRLIIEAEYYLPVRIQKKLVYLSLHFHEKENTGNKITKVEKGVSKIIDLLINVSWEVAPTILKLLVASAVLIIVDWRFGAVFIVFAPMFIYLTYKVNRDLRPVRIKRYKNYEKASGVMGQSIININTVKSFAQEEREVSEYSGIREEIKKASYKEWFKMMNYSFLREILNKLGRASILLLGVYLTWRGGVTVGTLIFVVTISEKSYSSLWRLSRFYDRIEEGAEAVNRFMDLINAGQDIKNPNNGIKPKDISGKIKFKNVSFSYGRNSEDALRNVSFNINAGCTTALVGPSGGGKTTVVRLAYRHYDPQGGCIKLDGKDLRDYDVFSFRKFFAIVPQEVEIFNASIRDNIAYAKPNIKFKEVEAAASIANAKEFIEKLPKKYDTEVGERGIRLSGGQRQRVGIARAVLANPRVLIFDEATSNLDSYSEKLIQDAMEKIKKGRTVIIIAHRLSTIRKADKIIVLEEGRVVEEGSHFELAQTKGGLYARLLELQRMGNIV